MTFAPRAYPAIVRDLLTTLTGGTVRETVTAPVGEAPILLDRLADRPVRRVSFLAGRVVVGDGPTAREIDYQFTPADFELVSTAGSDEPDAVRFREDGRRPAPGSVLTVNYYPVQTRPVPLTDLNVGSVVRTLLETVARELALTELLLEQVYRSAFVDTAEGSSLDRVVALVGISRLPAGTPVVAVRFSREAASSGRITVPVGTVVTTEKGDRYSTLAPLILEPGEPSRVVDAAGLSAATAPVDAGAIDRLEVLAAGVSGVTNEAPARVASAPEADEDLRRRARGALHVSVRGTVDAIRFGVKSVPGVKDVAVTEFPNGVPGEVRLDVAYAGEPDAATRREVADRVDELRPAGVRVVLGDAARTRVAVTVALTLAGTGVAPAELARLSAAVEERLAGHLGSLAPGGVARQAQLASMALSDPRIVDAAVTLAADGGPPTDRIELASGVVLELERPFTFPPPATEQAPGAAPATLAQVDVMLPVHLQPGVTAASVTEAVRLAAQAHLDAVSGVGGTTGGPTALTVDGLAAAVRDDTRFALVRGDVLVTVESGGRFLQLTDDAGSYPAPPNESLRLRQLDVDVREGNP